MKKPTKIKPADVEICNDVALADFLGITVQRVGQLVADGVISKLSRGKYQFRECVKNYIRYIQNRNGLMQTDSEGAAANIDELIERVKSAATYNDARTLKMQIDALRSGLQYQMDEGSSISRHTVKESLISIGNATRAAMLRMQADIPPMCEGMTAAQMQKVIKAKTHEILTMLADKESDFWKEKTNHEETQAEEPGGEG